MGEFQPINTQEELDRVLASRLQRERDTVTKSFQAQITERDEKITGFESTIADLNKQIEALARLHLHHGLYHSEGFKRQRRHVENMVREHKVNVRKELDPEVNLLYKRYFD
jgi:hypothetical protein